MSETLKNLCMAFVGESQARNRYTYYSKVAKNEGYVQISKIFLEIADQEKQHAKQLFKHIQELKENNEAIEVPTEVGTVFGTTEENLQAAIEGEHHEHSSMYPEMAAIAKEEGFDAISERLLSIAKAEDHHEEIYQKLLDHVQKKTILERSEQVVWVCSECGYLHLGVTPPEKCPSCDHAAKYFSVKNEDY